MRDQIVKLLFVILLSSLMPATMNAQSGTYSSTNKSAIKNYEAATKYYDQRQVEKAISELEKAISKDAAFIEAYVLLANLYVDKNDLEKAIDQYKKTIAINPNFFPNNYYTLGSIELNTGKYEDAKKHFEKFLTFPGTNPSFRDNAENRILSCEFALQALAHPVAFNPVNMGPAINSEFNEYLPSITVDNQSLFFTRLLPTTGCQQTFQEDFYISRKEKETWTKAVNAGPALNTDCNEGVPNISFDGKILFFAACNRSEGKGSCDIYYSRLKKEGWTRPINLGSPINTGAWESQPSFASDGRTLYFVRGFHDQNKQQDIYTSQIGNDGRWTEPVKLNSNINTGEDEEFVFIHPDNQTLYFSSDGHPGLGKLDIFVSRRTADGSWGMAQNLGYPINSNENERGLVVDPKGTTAFISSDRVGGIGGYDIYSFDLYNEARPAQVSYVKGIVSDSKSGIKLEAAFDIIDLESGNTVISSSSEKISGEFLACLTAGKDYSLNVSKDGYLFYSEHFSCKNAADIKNAYVLDVKLQPAEKGGKVILKNVFFDTNLFTLKSESFPELDKLVAFMKANASVTVQISGHTDSTGDKQKNQVLSENRAKAVYNYITGKSIPLVRLSYKGYGDAAPVAPNDTEEGRAKNRRTEFLITGM